MINNDHARARTHAHTHTTTHPHTYSHTPAHTLSHTPTHTNTHKHTIHHTPHTNFSPETQPIKTSSTSLMVTDKNKKEINRFLLLLISFSPLPNITQKSSENVPALLMSPVCIDVMVYCISRSIIIVIVQKVFHNWDVER